jgi:hypothetical protein
MSIASVKGSRVPCDWFEGSAAKQKVFDQKQLMPAETEKKDEIELARAVAFILYEGVKMTGQDPLKMSFKQQCEALGKIPSPR